MVKNCLSLNVFVLLSPQRYALPMLTNLVLRLIKVNRISMTSKEVVFLKHEKTKATSIFIHATYDE